MGVHLAAGVATAVGSLPHTDADAAADFVLERLPELPAIPSLPRRSPHEGILAHGLAGVAGIEIGDDGEVRVVVDRLDPSNPPALDLGDEAFGGLRAFLAAAAGRQGPVKWQVVGPVTLGLALGRRGAPPDVAFRVAADAVRAHLRSVYEWVADALPGCRQVVVIDEPGFCGVMDPGFPLPPEMAIDLASGALAAIEQKAVTGVHCCSEGDLAAIAAAGPAILSLPAVPALVEAGGHVCSFLEAGGWIAWGAVPTDGPVGTCVDRSWRDLSALWCSLVQVGCDAARVRSQAIVTPACGLAFHDEAQASSVLRLTVEIAERVREQAAASRVTVGA
jgi:hypothetical protein